MIAVSPRHSLYVERSGKPGGYPIVFLHGGPGSRSRAVHRRYFDPEFFDIVLFDQRGCGKSGPAGETQDNDTWALVEDINVIRERLGIHRKISLLGGSWGSTLALAYALRYPQYVDELLLRGVFLGSDEEVTWFTRGLQHFAPEAWEKFSAGNKQDLLQYYYQAVMHTDPQIAHQAANNWADYEMEIMKIGAGQQDPNQISALQKQSAPARSSPQPSNQEVLHSTRVQLHFLKHQCFLTDSPLLDVAHNIHLPVTIVQGRLDLVCPPVTACRLSQRLPQANLRIVPDAGHSALAGSLALALKEEADRLRDRLRYDQTGRS